VHRNLKCSSNVGVKQGGYTGPPVAPYDVTVGTSVLPPTSENLHSFMNQILKELNNIDESGPFREPVDAEDVPDYYDIIKTPMDLGTMQKRVDSGKYYITLEIFLADLRQVWKNAKEYNGEDTIFAKAANNLDRHVEQYLLSHRHFRPA
jgi:histone acetyltransferase